MQPAARPRPRRGWLVAAALAGVAVLVAVVLVVEEHERFAVPPTGCGGQPVVDLDGQPATCTFDDEFSGTALDPTKWQPLSTTRVGFHSGFECFVDDAQHIAEANGVLQLRLTGSRSGTGCRRLGLPYESGMVNTKGRFAQTYGRFSIRAKLPATPGMQPALWLYPQRLTYGRWPRSGEVDIAEVFGSAAQTWPHLHYLGASGETHPGRACPVAPNRSGFHTYSVDWTPTVFTFRYDGALCTTIDQWTPAAPLAAPAPFDRPFFVLLELATGIGANAPRTAIPIPQTMQVDYVRVWGKDHNR
jgi:beta-glucanase (GH16 family)